MLYFDHAASTPPEPEVIETVAELMRRAYGNPSSLHRAGVEAERLLAEAAERQAAWWEADPDEVIFTSGGTESNNLAIFGATEGYPLRGRHLITTMIEHSSVYECFRKLERSGYEVTWLEPDETGAVRAETVAATLRDDTSLVSVMAVNNETGRVQPVEEIGQLFRDRPRTLFHVDAVQAAGRLPLLPHSAGIDMLSISGHKFGGPKGVGALYRRKGLDLAPMLYGGGQQQGLRSGTENVPLIVGLVKAYRLAEEQRDKRGVRLYKLRRLLINRLTQCQWIKLTGLVDDVGMAPHIAHFRVPRIKSEVFLHAMEQRGICVSSQSACSSRGEEPSRVLVAMGFEREEAIAGIRVSLSDRHSEQDVEHLASSMIAAVEELAKWME